jgi:hypothetical protein
MNILRITPITFGDLNQFNANGIVWKINVERGATEAIAECHLIWAREDGGTEARPMSFYVEINNETLQSWGEDDSVIDDVIIAYSPLFVKL